MALNVTLSPRHQMLAAAAAMIAALGVGIGHVQAETVNSQTAETLAALAPAPTAAERAAAIAAAEASAIQQIDERHITCVAKVVHHEAANQPKKGQIAVAHVLVNRVKEGFGDDVCAVANQPGQFFRLNRYHPDRKSADWAQAVDVARAVLAGETRDHSNGALFFHANWAKLNGFFRTRTKVARVEDHSFFR